MADSGQLTNDAIPSVELDLSLDEAGGTPFFAREDLGFGPETFRAIAEDVSRWVTHASSELASTVAGGPQEVARAVLPWVALALAFVAAAFSDRRARRAFVRLAGRLTAARPTESPRVDAARNALVGAAGTLVVPVAAWALSYVPIQGMFASAPWSVALSRALGLFVAYRALVAAIRAVLGGAIFDFPPDSARRLQRIGVSSARAILVFAVASDTVATMAWRQDVLALAQTALRASITILSLRVLAAYRHIARLLPESGHTRYLRLRAAIAAYLPHFLGLSVLMLGLWTFGFERAATTILLRSYAIAGLGIAGILAMRWFDRATTRPHDNALVRALVARVDTFARVCIAAGFGAALLGLLGLLGPLLGALDAVGVAFGESRVTLLGVFGAVVVLTVAVLISRIARVLLEHLAYPRFGLEVGAAYATDAAVHYFVLALAVGVALTTLGVDLRALTVFAGALGVGIGFGLQDFARDTIGGFVLLFGRTVEKGDLVTLAGDRQGIVEDVGGRAVRVRTRDNLDLIIPAADVVRGTIVNWTHSSPLVRIRVPVGVAYDSDVREVEQALIEAALRYEMTLPDPAPDVLLTQFGESSVDFELLVWISAARVDPNRARGKLLFYVWDVLAERGITIPFPQRDLHLQSISPAVAAALRADAPSED